MYLKINEKIEKRREELGLSEVYIHSKTGITDDEYWDIRAYPNEIFTVTPLYDVKALMQVLSLDFFDLFEVQCAFCKENNPFLEEYLLPRNELIKKRRMAKGMSEEELGGRVGFSEIAIADMEKDKNYLEEWCLENITNLANALDIPLQILLGLKCNKCDR